MKKTFSTSISGIVFHIEEDAYDKLHMYLEAITNHFKGFDGKEEVIADVEARIAEILQTKISASKEVINLEDVDEVISILGKPSDFGPEEEAGNTGASSYYRPVPKRLYRDGDHKVLGGVCSGLGAYFNIDPVWVRIIFLVAVAVSGSGFLVYIILWLVVPVARTTAEKLEMRGEPVTVSNIEKNFKEEMNDLKDNVKDFVSQTKTNLKQEKDALKARHGAQVRNGFREIGRAFLRIFVVFFGVIILFTGIALTVVYLSVLLRFPVVAVMDQAGMQAFPLYALVERIFSTDTDLRAFVTGVMILAGIPLVMMIWGGIRLIFNLPRVKFLAGIAGFVWICALIITLVFGFKVANSFSRTGEFARQVPFGIDKTDTLFVRSEGILPVNEYWERTGIYYFDEARMAVRNDTQVIYGIPLLKFKLSSDSTGHINVVTISKGTSTMNAVETAEMVDYKWKQNGDTLLLNDNFTLAGDQKWRMQKTKVEVLLPEGTSVIIDPKVQPLMGYHRNISFHEPIGTLFVMTNDGLVGAPLQSEE